MENIPFLAKKYDHLPKKTIVYLKIYDPMRFLFYVQKNYDRLLPIEDRIVSAELSFSVKNTVYFSRSLTIRSNDRMVSVLGSYAFSHDRILYN